MSNKSLCIMEDMILMIHDSGGEELWFRPDEEIKELIIEWAEGERQKHQARLAYLEFRSKIKLVVSNGDKPTP